MEEKEFDFIEFLRILNKWRKPIITIFFAVSIVTAVISLFLTKYYTSEAVIISPEKDTGSSIMSSIISKVPIAGMMGFGSGDDVNLRYMAILNSRTLLERISKEFDLQNIYKTPNIEETVKQLRGNCKFVINEDNTLSIRVTDRSPQQAADMANAFVSSLDEENRNLKGEEAKNFREFIEDRFYKNREDLKAAEEAFSAFQKKYNAISITEQTAASIEIAAGLLTQVYELEIQPSIKEKVMKQDHSDLEKLRMEIKAIKDKLNDISFEGDNLVKVAAIPETVLLPLVKLPVVA